MVCTLLSQKHYWYWVMCLSLLAGCSSSNIYLNSENDPYACKNKPPIQSEQCMDRSMTAEEYHKAREEILREEQ
jgi:hypothetical protein